MLEPNVPASAMPEMMYATVHVHIMKPHIGSQHQGCSSNSTQHVAQVTEMHV